MNTICIIAKSLCATNLEILYSYCVCIILNQTCVDILLLKHDVISQLHHSYTKVPFA